MRKSYCYFSHVSCLPSNVIKWEIFHSLLTTPPPPPSRTLSSLPFPTFSSFFCWVTSFSIRLSADAIDGNDLGVGVAEGKGRVEWLFLNIFFYFPSLSVYKGRLTVIDFFEETADNTRVWQAYILTLEFYGVVDLICKIYCHLLRNTLFFILLHLLGMWVSSSELVKLKMEYNL